ncbi:hypothetical protein N9Y92_02795 [Chlamydiales bacterium]|nr:hypothetical protein [Chlamydiales bacterium]
MFKFYPTKEEKIIENTILYIATIQPENDRLRQIKLTDAIISKLSQLLQTIPDKELKTQISYHILRYHHTEEVSSVVLIASEFFPHIPEGKYKTAFTDFISLLPDSIRKNPESLKKLFNSFDAPGLNSFIKTAADLVKNNREYFFKVLEFAILHHDDKIPTPNLFLDFISKLKDYPEFKWIEVLSCIESESISHPHT